MSTVGFECGITEVMDGRDIEVKFGNIERGVDDFKEGL
jgi:hypothetical protein